MGFCELKAAKGPKTPWGCNVVASTLDKDLLKALKVANCTELRIGVETGSPRILADIGKPNTIEGIKRVFRETREMGFQRRAYFHYNKALEEFDERKYELMPWLSDSLI